MTEATMKRFRVICMGLVFWIGMGLGAGSRVFGYEDVAVTSGGVLTGKVTLDGPIPEPRIFPLALYPFGPFCEKNRNIFDGHGGIRINEFTVGPHHGLKDVVVAVQGVEEGKPFQPIVASIVAR